jgi:hypothetical protein
MQLVLLTHPHVTPAHQPKGVDMEAQRTPAQWFALLAGLFLVALGILTLFVSPVDFGTTRDPRSS